MLVTQDYFLSSITFAKILGRALKYSNTSLGLPKEAEVWKVLITFCLDGIIFQFNLFS